MDQVDVRLAQAQKALARVAGFKSGLYEDFKEGILSEDEYKLAKIKYEDQYKELSEQVYTLTMQKNKQTDMVAQNKWASALSSFSDGKELNRELITSIIERIDVSSDGNVAITVKYRDEQAALLRMLNEFADEEVAV